MPEKHWHTMSDPIFSFSTIPRYGVYFTFTEKFLTAQNEVIFNA